MTDYSETLKNIDAGRVLDIATGSGYFLDLVLQNVNSYTEAVGIDFKESIAEVFAGTFKENRRVSFKVMDATKMEFADASFDTVCISNSLHHLADPMVVLTEMKRVLKPGGWFIISEMYQDGQQAETQKTHVLLHHWLAAVDTLNNVVHNETYRRQQFLAFADELGLKKVKTCDIADLSEDPLDPQIAVEYGPIIDRYIQRAEGHPDLQEFGETMRERLKTIGYHNASNLLLLAKK
jgi:ubiquinone/menaquinone biosynthesis C-methylase UbiE